MLEYERTKVEKGNIVIAKTDQCKEISHRHKQNPERKKQKKSKASKQ